MSVLIKTGSCMLCGKPGYLDVSEEMAQRIVDWKRSPHATRPFVQVAFPDLSPADREQLMNGSHEACFDLAFPEEDEDE